MNLDYPLHFDARGRTAEAGLEDHVRDLIEQTLFTAPGERVNRPDFGAGLRKLVHELNSKKTVEGLELAIRNGLHDLRHRLQVGDLSVTGTDDVIEVQLSYVVSRSGEKRDTTLTFPRK